MGWFFEITLLPIRSALSARRVRSSPPEMFFWKGILKKRSKFTGEHPCWSVISINLQSNYIKITSGHGCSPVNLLCIFRTSYYRNTSEKLQLSLGLETVTLFKLFSNCLLTFFMAVFSWNGNQSIDFHNRLIDLHCE